jgi:hypothetical protein
MPPAQHADCVGAMEEVLEVSHRPRDPQRPVVGFDAARQPRVQATRTPMPAAAGRPATTAYAYERHGPAHLCMRFVPLAGRRERRVTARRTAGDEAEALRHLVAVCHPKADQIILGQDNLKTPKLASLSEAFPPEEARRLIEKLEGHATPKHGSWLHMAETALRILSRPCLDRRLPDRATLTAAVAAWERERHAAPCRVDWQCTTAEARVKLKRLYPVLQPVNSGVLDH